MDIITILTKLDDLPKTKVCETRPPSNSHDYTRANCERFGIPFLTIFYDIDTYIDEGAGKMRIQGYLHDLESIKTWDAEERAEELAFLFLLTEKAEWAKNSKNKTIGEVWSHEVFLPGYPKAFKTSGLSPTLDEVFQWLDENRLLPDTCLRQGGYRHLILRFESEDALGVEVKDFAKYGEFWNEVYSSQDKNTRDAFRKGIERYPACVWYGETPNRGCYLGVNYYHPNDLLPALTLDDLWVKLSEDWKAPSPRDSRRGFCMRFDHEGAVGVEVHTDHPDGYDKYTRDCYTARRECDPETPTDYPCPAYIRHITHKSDTPVTPARLTYPLWIHYMTFEDGRCQMNINTLKQFNP